MASSRTGNSLTIYNESGIYLFSIPSGAHLIEAIAVTDTTLLAANRNTLSYWNIKTQKTIWESDIHGKNKVIVDEASRIQFSIHGNIITLININ